ncbi:hypothetical protein AUEXF2481DRAFT_683201 [Aureobasidium subglaciale EXF-2481]|uniref:Secreted protein n=1 Tax=Aureobasidium subglaciale (strain EXF-2481) TaxID=1043005 RepID=A0A074ZAA2_AURSE|nr:uncharacterized protein AUEXF2481DRAFT_683201 [Aureobasidium subglaciale EXF-2481]KEQ95696.1 hypothetical protein AUEXF2481DRAFT_683201 [Aureobasidium subglaciale EXF-2481]
MLRSMNAGTLDLLLATSCVLVQRFQFARANHSVPRRSSLTNATCLVLTLPRLLGPLKPMSRHSDLVLQRDEASTPPLYPPRPRYRPLSPLRPLYKRLLLTLTQPQLNKQVG